MPCIDLPSGWEATYTDWLARALPLVAAGKARLAYVDYPAAQPGEAPFTPFSKPLAQTRLAVLSTAGFYLTESQAPFTAEDMEGDASYRELPPDVKPTDLSIAHTHYPHEAALADWNAVLPLDHLRAMVARGELGGIGPIFSISGYCTDAALLCRTTGEEIAAKVRAAGCDAMLFVPV